MTNLIFVYGTLRNQSDSQMSKWLASRATRVGKAKVQGKLYLIDYYPGMKASNRKDDWVVGEIYQLSEFEDNIHCFDEYEGIGELYTPPFEY